MDALVMLISLRKNKKQIIHLTTHEAYAHNYKKKQYKNSLFWICSVKFAKINSFLNIWSLSN